jgi:hypothetical protein
MKLTRRQRCPNVVAPKYNAARAANKRAIRCASRRPSAAGGEFPHVFETLRCDFRNSTIFGVFAPWI